MDNYGGDLTDIIRASGGPLGGVSNPPEDTPVGSWQFSPVSDGNYLNPNCDDFGDPFSHIKDPLLDELDLPKSPFFNNSNNNSKINSTPLEAATGTFSQKDRPGNFFSRMLQISPSAKRPIITSDVIITGANTSTSGFVENSVGLQISSPRNTGIKRRKSQAKKVVCIPAPAPVNSRPSGEVVPSDLWAWRKYGQKPIKGSPFPRGYYRCSSSKGCSARKQVERSRTDPNMLVITYTSEHNHPWPTQRNALAGSTRSQPSKNLSSPRTPTQALKEPLLNIKEEPTNNVPVSSPPLISEEPTSNIKEEMEDYNDDMEMNEDENASYRPQLPPDMTNNSHSDDFFAELGEIGDDDPLHLLFNTSPGFPNDHDHERDSNKTLDAFTSFFDWTGNSNTNNNSSFGETKRGL